MSINQGMRNPHLPLVLKINNFNTRLMKLSLITIFIAFFLFSCGNDKKSPDNKTTIVLEETTTYYLIRHAEKDQSDKTNRDPELTKIGLERARAWAGYFENMDLTMVYSTDYKRTQQTALPTAVTKRLEVLSYNPSNLYSDEFKAATKGNNVLIVGHSNTTPAFVNAILGKETFQDIDERENGMLYTVTVTDKGATAAEEKIEF